MFKSMFQGGGWALGVDSCNLLLFSTKVKQNSNSSQKRRLRLFCKDWLCGVGLCALQMCLNSEGLLLELKVACGLNTQQLTVFGFAQWRIFSTTVDAKTKAQTYEKVSYEALNPPLRKTDVTCCIFSEFNCSFYIYLLQKHFIVRHNNQCSFIFVYCHCQNFHILNI